MSDQVDDRSKKQEPDLLRGHSFMISPAVLKKIGQAAQKKGVSRNAIVREALEQYFSREHDMQELQQEVRALHEAQGSLAAQIDRVLTLEAAGWFMVGKGQLPAQFLQNGQAWLDASGLRESEGER